jgi:dihydrodipicolinate synthase/N-acetylneuraminate lyase
VKPLRGYIAAVVTPFDRTGHLDAGAFRTVIQILTEEKMHGLTIAGTTGEWPSLSQRERIQIFEHARNFNSGGLPLIAGCSSTRLKETLQFASCAHALAYDAILVSIPAYLDPTESEVLAFFESVASESKLPVLIYNWPPGTGKDLSPRLLTQLIQIPGVIGIKNSTSSSKSFDETLLSIGSATQIFGIMPGERGLALLQHPGASGCIGASGALGESQPRFFEEAWSGNSELAKKWGAIDESFMKEFFEGYRGRFGHAISTIKALMNLRGIPAGQCRSPLLELSSSTQKQLKDFILRNGLKIYA